jgi:recombination associated protein RdgC
MWFKNLQVFNFTEKFTMTPEVLGQQLEAYAFREVRAGEQVSRGWVSPGGEEDQPLVHVANGFMLLCLRIEEKMVPASVVREILTQRIELLEEKEGRKVYKKEKERLKDEVFFELLGRAFSKNQRVYGCIDLVDGNLWVDAASMKKAELFTTELRRALGTLKIQLPQVMNVPLILTDWVQSKKLPAEFVILDNFVIEDVKTGGVIRGQKQEIFADDIQSLFDGSRHIIQLGLAWCDLVSLVLKQDFSIKSLKFLQEVKAEASDIFTETKAQRFDADFAIMTQTLRDFWRSIYGMFKTDEMKIAKVRESEVEMS